MYVILNSSLTQYGYCIFNFYPTFLPTYKIKTIDLGFNQRMGSNKRCYTKGLGKQLMEGAKNHYCRKNKKRSKLKFKILNYEKPKPF